MNLSAWAKQRLGEPTNEKIISAAYTKVNNINNQRQNNVKSCLGVEHNMAKDCRFRIFKNLDNTNTKSVMNCKTKKKLNEQFIMK